MNDAPLLTLMAASSRNGTWLPDGVATRMLPMASGVSRKLRRQAHHEVEQLLALHDLRGGTAADGRFDDAVDRLGAEAVPRDLRAIDGERQRRLAELLHERDVRDAPDFLDQVLELEPLRLQHGQVRRRRPSRRASS